MSTAGSREEWWVQDSRAFYRSLNAANRRARSIAACSHERSSRRATPAEIEPAMRIVRQRIGRCRRLREMEWHVRFLDDADRIENNYPHTFGDAVMLPVGRFRGMSTRAQAELLLHEAMHVYQRTHPIPCHRLITRLLGYRVLGLLSALPEYARVRRNPDLNDVVYVDADGKYTLSMLHPNATTLREARLVLFDAETRAPIPEETPAYEHPFEHMAYVFAEAIMADRLPAAWFEHL